MDAMNMIDWVLKLFTWDVHCNVWRLTAGCALPDDVCEMVGLEMTRRLVARSDPSGGLGRFRLTVLGPRQAVAVLFIACLCDVLTQRYYTWIGRCCAMSG